MADIEKKMIDRVFNDFEGEPDNQGLNYIKAMIYPFKEKDYLLRLGWVLIMAMIPVLDLFIFRGWRLDIVRRIGRKQPEKLPQFKDLGQFMADGLVLWLMTFIYLTPLTIFIAIVGISKYAILLEIVWWVIGKVTAFYEVGDFPIAVTQTLMVLIVELTVPAIYLVISSLIYRAGMIRYSVTGKVASFFQLWKNIEQVLWNLPGYIFVFFVQKILNVTLLGFLAGVVSSILAVSVIGAVLLPFVPAFFLSAHYWSTGYLFGHLALQAPRN